MIFRQILARGLINKTTICLRAVSTRRSHLCGDVLPGQTEDGDFLGGGWLGVSGP